MKRITQAAAAALVTVCTGVPAALAATPASIPSASGTSSAVSAASTSTSQGNPSSAVHPETAAPSAQSTAASASQWMWQKQATKMPDWTAIATFAATGKRQVNAALDAEASGLSTSTDAARFILGALAAGEDPHQTKSGDVVAKLARAQLTSGQDAGKFADNLDRTGTDLINAQAWAIIALEDAGGASYNRAAAAQWLLAHQNDDGGFGYSSQYSSSDADDTASALVALSLLGYTADNPAVAKAIAFLKTQQADDGGFVNGGKTSNADSTGVVVDALESLGIDPQSWAKPGGTPLSALLSFYDSASGGFRYDNTGGAYSGVSGYSTRDALIGLGALQSGRSVYQRLHWQHFTWLNSYWAGIYRAGGAWDHGQWKSWAQLRAMAVAGSYVWMLTPDWQAVVKAHGKWVVSGGHKVWVPWGEQLAEQALRDSFGLDTVHLNLL
ncbi:prenyltransferase/squalene oxidase repeat-containing protein [Alicyclobacillus macrosporangiidus]|uniref:prenyltransferase/squalene oxidase repeat-containing protein n=1 Tax=Alicyclobacillus macrosporangiidus TaxID=392015 RepID=UPI000B166D35|nr:prenyltransferase/squalene oxidase repeat-containing protein [Alicyclobacillus macrosporangiidus]